MENKTERPLLAPPLTKEEKLRFVLKELRNLCNCYAIKETLHEITIEATFTKKKEP